MITGYIARNPVAHGFCPHPEAWPWSSHAAVLTGDATSVVDLPRLLHHFTAFGEEPHRRYAECVDAAMAMLDVAPSDARPASPVQPGPLTRQGATT